MTTQNLYQKTLNEEMSPSQFLWHVRRDPQYNDILTNTMSYEDTVSCLKSKGYIWEAQKQGSNIKSVDFLGSFKQLTEASNKKQKLKGGKGDKITPDQVNYYEFRKGWKHELEHTDDIDKAKEIALDHLSEDPMYYTRLEIIEFEAKKKERADLPIDISKKKSSVKDEKNQMTPAKNKKKETTNVSDSGKQEKARSKNAGVKKMKGGSGEMKSVKEQYVNEEDSSKNTGKFKLVNPGKEDKEVKLSYPQYNTVIQNGYYSKVDPMDQAAKDIVTKYESITKNKERTQKEKEIKKSSPKSRYEIKFKGGFKKSEVSLTDKEAEDRIKNPDKYGIESITKKSFTVAAKDRKDFKYDEYPYYVYDKDKNILIGIERVTFGKEYEKIDKNRYTTVSNIQAKNIAQSRNATYEKEPKKDKKGYDPNKKYYVVDTSNFNVLSSFDLGDEAKAEAKAKNREENTTKYEVLTKDSLNVRMNRSKYKKEEEPVKKTRKRIYPVGSPKSAFDFVKKGDTGSVQEQKEEPKLSAGLQVSFSIQDPENLSSIQQVRDTVKSASFNGGQKRLTMSLSGGAEVVFTADASGEPVGIYFSKSDTEEDVKKSQKVTDIKDPLNKILDKYYPKPKDVEEATSNDSILEDYIRKRIKEALKEGDEGQFIGMVGPNVIKKKLIDYMQKYSPDWETDPSPLQRSIGSEYQGIIAKLVAELNDREPGLGTSIYKEYTGKALRGDQAYQATPPPSTLAYDPAKLVSRGGRIAEEFDAKKEAELLKNIQRYNDVNSSEFKQALKDLQAYVTSLGSTNIGKDAKKAIMHASDLNK